MDGELYTLRDAARILRVQPHVLVYLFSTRKLPEPMRVGGRRLFTIVDLQRLKEFIDQRVELRRGDHADPE